MKKFTNLAIAILFTVLVQPVLAQIQINPYRITANASIDSTQVDFKGNFKNNFSNTRDFVWQRIVPNTMPAAWRVAVCDNNICWGDNLISPSANITLASGTNSLFDVYVKPMGTVGSGTQNFIVYDVADPANTTQTVSYTLNVSATGVKNIYDVTNISIYPIPCKDYLYVNASSNQKSIPVLDVFNMLGNKILTVQNDVANKQFRINLAQLTNGVYFLHLRDAQGKVFAIKRFTKIQ